jgi:hypothetical protein
MTFDTQTYIDTLAAAHGLAAKPGDTNRSNLTERAVRAELADIKTRTQNLHNWSATIVASHQADTTSRGQTPGVTIDLARPGCRCALRRPDRRPGCRCKPRHH